MWGLFKGSSIAAPLIASQVRQPPFNPREELFNVGGFDRAQLHIRRRDRFANGKRAINDR